MAKVAARVKKALVAWARLPCGRRKTSRLLKSTGRKVSPAAKIAKALKRTESATRQKAKSERISLSMTRKKRAPTNKR